MKHNLGKLLIFFMSIFMLHAGDFNYAIHVDKHHPYVKEAVLLTVDLNQTNHDIVLLFDFDLVKSDAYTFQRINIKEIDTYHASKIRYTYLLYPLKSTKVDIHFSLTQKATTDDSIAYSFSGDRDNVKTLETRNAKIDLPPLRLEVQSLPKGTQVVGDFSLTHTVKTLEAKAFEPLPIQVTLKGLGYPPVLESLLPTEGNFTRFTETPVVKASTTQYDTQSTVTYPMALSHDKSFTLKPIVIHAFNPTTQKRYALTVPAQHFNITQVNKSTLIDKVDTPSLYEVDWSWMQTLFTYLIVFVAGYLSALTWRLKSKENEKHQHPMVEKIQHAKTPKILLQVLLSNDATRFTKSIQELESHLYHSKTLNLKKVKESALEKII